MALLMAATHPVWPAVWQIGTSIVARDDAERRLQYVTWSTSHDADITIAAVIINQAIYLACSLAIVFIVTLIYKMQVTDKREPFPQPVQNGYSMARSTTGDFQEGMCSCFEDLHSCLYGFCCFDCRVADTLQAAGLSSYWTIFGVFIIAWIVTRILAVPITVLLVRLGLPLDTSNLAWWIVGICLALFFASKRQDMRRKLGYTGQQNFVIDWLMWWCCGCCVAIQEARQIDAASGTRVECCFNLLRQEHTGGAVVVGKPVAVPPVAVVVAAPVAAAEESDAPSAPSYA
jgi:Cys-rich protein (TIGR01571 family)